MVGLGNPGRPYASTRHNVGFMVVEHLAARWNIDLGAPSGRLRTGTGRVAGAPAVLVEPQEYMNRSGESLGSLDAGWRGADLIVIYDDMDLPAGRLRLRRSGGAGGHRGAASLIAHFGAEFDRVRIGVGRPLSGMDPAEFVLAEMSEAERESLQDGIALASDAVESILSEGIERAMDRFNRAAPMPLT